MSAEWDAQRLIEPITPDLPCGENLDDSDGLAALDAFQIFGQTSLDPEPKDPAAPGAKPREPRPSDRPPNWQAIRDLSIAALAKTRDFRPLAHLGAAVLRTDGVAAFTDTLKVGSAWLETYWASVHPKVDEGVIFRQNALNCFADRAAIVEGLRRAPLVSSRQHGKVSLRDCDIAAGHVVAGEKDVRSDEARIAAAFGTAPLEDLERLRDSVAAAAAALEKINETMRTEAGVEAAADFDPLSAQLAKVTHVVQSQLALRPDGGGGEAPGADAAAGATGVVGAVRSREDAIRALDAVANFFRKAEPSSPIPLFVERAKRLVSKSFLEVLADVVPDAVPQVRAVGGIPEGQ
jgi:type VI secretion system protein ImpA